MKKSLSVILSTAMAVSMFSSVAFGAETNLTTQQKYDAMKALGIFEGTDGGAAGLDQNMTRAQFAKIVSLLKQLAPDVASSAVYNDLDGATWAAGVIGSGTKAGYFDGVAEHKFAPSGEVTVEQLAAVMVRVLKLNVDNNAAAAGASDWAKGYVKAALDEHLIPQQNNYNVPASRAALVDGTYVAYTKLAPPVVTPPAVTANASVTIDKISAYQQLGVNQDLSVTVTDKTYGTPIANAEVTFVIDGKQVAGNENIIKKVNTDANGKAKVSYSRAVAGADDISIYLTSNPAARATTSLWWNSAAKAFDVGTMTDITQANGSSRTYTFTAYDTTTGAALQNAAVNIGFAEDMLPSFGVRTNGARINGNPITNTYRSAVVTTDSNGRGVFTISGTDVSLSPVLFIDRNLDNTLNPTEVRSFVAKTAFNATSNGITITPLNTSSVVNLNSQRVYKVKVTNPDGTPATNAVLNVGLKELLDATTANDPGARLIWVDNDATLRTTPNDGSATNNGVTAVGGAQITLGNSITPNADGEFTFAIYNGAAAGSAQASRPVTPIVWIDTIRDNAMGVGEVSKEAAPLSFVAEFQGSGRLGVASGNVLENLNGASTTLRYTALNEDGTPITPTALTAGSTVTFTVRNTGSNAVSITGLTNGAVLPTTLPLTVAAGSSVQVSTALSVAGTPSVVTAGTVDITLNSASRSTVEVTAQLTGFDNTAAAKLTANWYPQGISQPVAIAALQASGTFSTDVTLTAVQPGVAGNAIKLVVTDRNNTTTDNVPVVTVEGNKITANINTNLTNTSLAATTRGQLATAINNAAGSLVTAVAATPAASAAVLAQTATTLSGGTSTTAATLTANTNLVLTAKNQGTAGNSIQLITVNGATNVTVEGNVITVTAATTLAAVNAINANNAASALVTASGGDGTALVATTASTNNLTAGADSTGNTNAYVITGKVTRTTAGFVGDGAGSFQVLTAANELVTLSYKATDVLRVGGVNVSANTFESALGAGDVISYTNDATVANPGLHNIVDITTNN